MGMDVFGKNAVSETGKYFRASVWSWRPLADYVMQIAPEITSKCESWHTNDGFGLNADDARKLADIIQAEIDSGRTAIYIKERNEWLESLPSEPCAYCENGVTTQAIADKYPAYAQYIGKECIQCKGVGSRRPVETWYGLDIERVQRFVDFMRCSGGFEIN